MNLDDLCQRAADNSTARHAALLDAIQIAADAMRAGPGAVGKVAEHIHYGKNTVKKLAAMEGLPPELVDLDAKVGMYWVALMNAPFPIAAIREALEQGITTPAGMKKLLGVEEKKEDGKWVNNNGLLVSVDGQYLTVFIEDDWHPATDAPERVRVSG